MTIYLNAISELNRKVIPYFYETPFSPLLSILGAINVHNGAMANS